MTQTQKEIMPGVFLRNIQSSKFKSAYCSVSLQTPLKAETASLNMLIPWVLRRGTTEHPTMESLASAFDDLYGASVGPATRKRGETQCVGFVASLLDDAYTFDNSKLLEPLTKLLGEMLFSPVTEEGVFSQDFVQGERNNLVQRIQSKINNKQSYAMGQMLKEMCQGEAYGVDSLGTLETAQAITPETLWAQYEYLLRTSEIYVYFCGTAQPERVEAAVRAMLAPLPPRGELVSCPCQPQKQAEAPKFIQESLDVTQGKLVMGFSTGGITVWEKEHTALVLANALFGGTSMSKLFMNVREKLSLCYYASSMLERYKGILLVSSGIEFDKFDQAKEEILAQLQAVKEGDFTQEDLEGARRMLVNNVRSLVDEQGSLEEFWTGQTVARTERSPEDYIRELEACTLEQVVAASQKVELDTVYFLKGLEE